VDRDGSNSLSYDEYQYMMGALAAVDARLQMKAFDEDNNGILTAKELSKWQFGDQVFNPYRTSDIRIYSGFDQICNCPTYFVCV